MNTICNSWTIPIWMIASLPNTRQAVFATQILMVWTAIINRLKHVQVFVLYDAAIKWQYAQRLIKWSNQLTQDRNRMFASSLRFNQYVQICRQMFLIYLMGKQRDILVEFRKVMWQKFSWSKTDATQAKTIKCICTNILQWNTDGQSTHNKCYLSLCWLAIIAFLSTTYLNSKMMWTMSVPSFLYLEDI